MPPLNPPVASKAHLPPDCSHVMASNNLLPFRRYDGEGASQSNLWVSNHDRAAHPLLCVERSLFASCNFALIVVPHNRCRRNRPIRRWAARLHKPHTALPKAGRADDMGSHSLG